MDTFGRAGRKIEFVAVGHLAVDRRNGHRSLGGSAAYGSLTASRLGLSTAMVTAVGEDFDFFDPLEGIETHFHRSGASTSFENIYQGEIRRQRLHGLASPLVEEDLAVLEGRLAEDAVVLFCPIAKEVQAPFGRLVEQGLSGVAPQGFFRSWDDQGAIHPAPWEDAPRRLAEADFVSLSVSDVPDPDRLVRRLAGRVPVFALTESEEGARIYADGRMVHVPAFRRDPRDPTGAGDVFAASFLVALRASRDPLEAARFACCAASFAVERDGIGGVPPDRSAVEERLARYREQYGL